MGGQAIGQRNIEGERVLEFAVANELVVGNLVQEETQPPGNISIWGSRDAEQLCPVPAHCQQTSFA